MNLINKRAMLVIHPKDKTTAVLAGLYEGLEVCLLDNTHNNKVIEHHLNHTPKHERIMLLGHGSDKGLFSREDDEKDEFDRLIIRHTHAYYLRNHGANIVAVWCNADLFARKEKLHGLFTGMIISEMSEAEMYKVETTQEELDRENIKLVKRLRALLDEGISLHEIPQRMLEMDDAHTPLTEFNYKNFFYL